MTYSFGTFMDQTQVKAGLSSDFCYWFTGSTPYEFEHDSTSPTALYCTATNTLKFCYRSYIDDISRLAVAKQPATCTMCMYLE